MNPRAPHLCTVLLLASCAASPTRSGPQDQAAAKYQHIAIYLGERSLDEDDWEPVEEQGTFGVEYSNDSPGQSVGWEIGLMASAEEDDVGAFDVEGMTSELYGGVRHSFETDGAVRPYVGGGISLISAEAEVSLGGVSVDEDDSSPALYVHGGVAFDVTEAFYLGIDLRILAGSDIEILGVDGDADYTQFALVLGFGF